MPATEAPLRTLSWGFGTQSTALACMSVLGEIPPYDLIIGADLGWETQATYESVNFYRQWLAERGANVVILRTGNIREEGAQAHVHIPFFTATGAPLQRQCTSHFKIRPIRRYLRQHLGYPPSTPPAPPAGAIEQHLGITTDECQRMKTSRVQYIVNRYPLCTDLRMSRLHVLEWFKEHGLPVPPKSACKGCPFRSDREWLRMKREAPDDFADAAAFDEENRRNPHLAREGVFSPELYVHQALIPLGEIDFEGRVKEKTAAPLFCESGFCHV